MRSNEYYSRTYIIFIIWCTIVFYSIFTVISSIAVKDATALKTSDFTPNFDKKYRQVVVLEHKVVPDEKRQDDYSLSSVEYDMSTLYLNWSEIEAERDRIEVEAKAAEEAIKKQNNKPINIVKPSTTLKAIEGSLALPNISDTSFKGYMCIHKVTAKSSKQWKFLHSGEFELNTNNNGIMMYNEYYIVAMASYYTRYKIGSTFRITLDSGIVFDVIIGDEKADVDTDSSRTYRPKGSSRGEIVEFIIACGEDGANCNEYHTMTQADRRLGDLSSLGFQGNILKIEALDDYSVVNGLYK